MSQSRFWFFFVEEPSMEAFLQAFLPRHFSGVGYQIFSFQGKNDLLKKLPSRLPAFRAYSSPEFRLFILLDRDDDDCLVLKRQVEQSLQDVQIVSRSQAQGISTGWLAVVRIVVPELESWYFGDWQAVCEAYPNAPKSLPRRFMHPDTVPNAWEQFERVMQRAGYFRTGLPKVVVARQ